MSLVLGTSDRRPGKWEAKTVSSSTEPPHSLSWIEFSRALRREEKADVAAFTTLRFPQHVDGQTAKATAQISMSAPHEHTNAPGTRLRPV